MPARHATRRRQVRSEIHRKAVRGRGEEIMPDELRRTDQSETTPETLPRHNNPLVTDTRPDGGVTEHPIHDDDQEDKGPDQYEREFADAAEAEFEPVSEESQDVKETADEFDAEELGPRSIPPRDRD